VCRSGFLNDLKNAAAGKLLFLFKSSNEKEREMGKELDFVWRGERRNGGWMVVVVVVERGEERRISNVSLSVQRFSKLLQHCA